MPLSAADNCSISTLPRSRGSSLGKVSGSEQAASTACASRAMRRSGCVSRVASHQPSPADRTAATRPSANAIDAPCRAAAWATATGWRATTVHPRSLMALCVVIAVVAVR